MKYIDLGAKIKAERERLGIEQIDLAKRIGRGQQAVSRWENGASRPKSYDMHRLAEVLGGDINEWLTLGGYVMPEPTRSLSQHLPLYNLTEEGFEAFSRDLVKALKPGVEVYRVGGRGHKQDGVDIVAETEGGIDFQCKRHKAFGPADVAAAVQATTTTAATHHLLLSRIASPGARKEISKHEDWKLWDLDDLSAKMREIDIADAIRIINTYFSPTVLEDFLGVSEPSPWLSTQDFFRPFMDRNRIFNHGWDFVGRSKELATLKQINSTTDQRAFVVSGRGGIGKSRLLRAWADETAISDKVYFLSPGTEVTPKDFTKLSDDKCFIVIDDAHDRSDLIAVLSGIAQHCEDARIVISTRPYGLTRIRDDLTRAGLGYDDDALITMTDLTVDEAEALAVEVMQEVGENIDHARRIAEITKDCPLATVIGSRLVAEGTIGPDILNNSEKFRNELLRSFRDIVAGNVGGNDADAVRSLLNLVAMVQPVDPTDPAFKAAADKILGQKPDQITRNLRGLEDAGLLLRRSRKLRIAPDLLADYIRADASYNDRDQQPTGYVDDVFEAAADDLATNLLVNLSQLDWRLSSNEGVQAQLLAKVWSDIEAQFLKAKIFGRQAILKALRKVAYYQPEQALAFAQLAIENPITDLEEEAVKMGLGMGMPTTYRYVTEEIPPLLRYVAHHQPHLYNALDLLRTLATQDNRQQNQYPDHPVRVLRDLAAIEPGKPIYFNELILDHVLPWVNEDPELAFDILDQLLMTEGHISEAHGIRFELRGFKVNAEAVANIREKIINAAFEALQSNEPKLAFRALQTIERALERPHGLVGMTITAEDVAAWEPGIISTLERLATLVETKPISPYLTVQLRGLIANHARWNKGAIRVAADKVLGAIPATRENDIARAMADGWGWTFEREGGTMRNEELCAKWRDELADKIIGENNSGFDDLLAALEVDAKTMAELPLQRGADYGPFLGSLMRQSQDFTKALGEHLLINRESPLLGAFPIAITVLAKDDYDAAINLATRAVATGDVKLARCVSRALGWSLWDLPVGADELVLATQLAASDDPTVRHNLVRIVKRLGDNKDTILELLLSIRIDDDKDVAEEVLQEFGSHGVFVKEGVGILSASQRDQIFDQLVQLNTIDEYGIQVFISDMSAVDLDRVADLYMRRVETKETRYSDDDFDNKYKPIPYIHNNGPHLKGASDREYEAVLRRVRDWAAVETGNWVRTHYGKDLFKLVSAGYDTATLNVLGEWINSGDAKKLEDAAALLSEAPHDFVFTHREYVVATLEQSHKLGKISYDRVKSWLYGLAISGGRTGTPGQPFPRDIEMRDKSHAIMADLPVGSPGYNFYKLLNDAAKSNIERDTIDEEDLFDD